MGNAKDKPVLTALQKGEITIQGEFLWGSNYTFSVQVDHENSMLNAVYKPTRGERPLWDFPRATLARREVAAYLVSEALGWDLVPPTVYRKHAPAGPGSLQLFIEHDSEYHYFNFDDQDRQRLRPVAVFDILINNADRKGSHILLDSDRHMWLIDHGISFHQEDKLRTVVWDFAGEQIPEELRGDLRRLRRQLSQDTQLVNNLEHYLNLQEVAALSLRIDQLLKSNCFPNPHPNRRPYPWPPV
jgi:uncharacterized repeat protein (TIGR03843 family)